MNELLGLIYNEITKIKSCDGIQANGFTHENICRLPSTEFRGSGKSAKFLSNVPHVIGGSVRNPD